tara:strand:+ start:332 stop:2614 length:2283 start_codon:yes stop_codon:yes gene_type:complete
MKTIAIAGNPNCGKTVIFNALTGSRQKVGNWAGVTVDRKHGYADCGFKKFKVVDLPGVYSLSVVTDTTSQDERIACDYLLSGDAELVINVVDASNLERNLYLTAQLIEMQIPVIIVLNMMDVAKRHGVLVDPEKLSEQLGCPVIPMVANKGKGVAPLKQCMEAQPWHRAKATTYGLPDSIYHAKKALETSIEFTMPDFNATWLARRLLEDDNLAKTIVGDDIAEEAKQLREGIKQAEGEDSDMLIADARYQWVHRLAEVVSEKPKQFKQTFTEFADKIVLNRFLGIPIFLFVMYVMFLFAINIGGAFQDFFDIGSTTIFIDGFAHVLTLMHFPAWTVAVLANGLGKGINTVVTFVPVIGAMFLFLSFLEDSGYMARAAFVVDRLMRAIGLPGKAFVPLIVGFGCNVPTVMATRTLGSTRDRILTIMMAPFMSCGARLAVYAVFVSAFFPRGGQNIIFLLYLIGIITAVLTGLLLRMTMLKGQSTPMLMELPTYHAPHARMVVRNAWQRLKMFLRKAGRFIIPICIILGFLNGIGTHGQLLQGEANQNSVLSAMGKAVTPAFAPMGLQQDNWPATVGLASGLLAKEVVVGTLNTLYSQVGGLNQEKQKFNFWGGLTEAVKSVPENLARLPEALSNPIMASAAPHDVNQGVYGVMYQHFDGRIGAFAYLLFLLLYFPCVSTMAVMRREIHKSWATFSMVWTTGLAYGVATMFYQGATVMRHPTSSISWIAGIIAVFTSVIIFMRLKTKKMPAGKRVIPIVSK